MLARKYWYIVFPATALLWIGFKCCYPYPDFFTDSYTYIQAAADHNTISYRPIGYSLFLRLVHGVSHSDTVLVTIQFVLVQSSCWLLFATVCRRCSAGAGVQAIVMAFLVLNPLVYYISNFVSSDALFIALSLLWLTSLIRLTDTPSWRELEGEAIRQHPPGAATAYMWERNSPLHEYLDAFGRYYLVPSAGSFFLSSLDVFSTYRDGRKEIDAVARDWFGYRKTRPWVWSATLQGRICAPFPWLSLIMMLAFAAVGGMFLVSRELRDRWPGFTGCMRVAGIWLGMNICFNVFASPSVYRYLVLPLILLVIVTTCGIFVVTYRKDLNHD